jgi:hypothetical protein
MEERKSTHVTAPVSRFPGSIHKTQLNISAEYLIFDTLYLSVTAEEA